MIDIKKMLRLCIMRLKTARDYTGLNLKRTSHNPANIVRPMTTLRNEPEYARKKSPPARQATKRAFRNFGYSA
jgi:hypothetical protein